MIEIALLPFAAHQRVETLFAHPACAEGSLAWYRSLAQSTLTADEEPIFVVAMEGGHPLAALPLVRRFHALRALTAPYTTIYSPPLSDLRAARFLGKGAQSFVHGSFYLDALDPADPNIASFLDGLFQSGLMAAQYQHFVNFYERVGNVDDFWSARPSRLRTTVRRKLAQALSQQAEFRCYRNTFGEAVRTYEEIYEASWKQPEPHPSFIRTMVDNLGECGFVRIGIMTLGGKPVAAQIWLLCGRKATIFKLAHREDAQASSPGTLLTHWMISTLVREEALEEIDFGRGADAYKRDWLPESRMRSGVVAGNWKTVAGLRVIAGDVLPTRLSALARKAGALRV